MEVKDKIFEIKSKNGKVSFSLRKVNEQHFMFGVAYTQGTVVGYVADGRMMSQKRKAISIHLIFVFFNLLFIGEEKYSND